MKEAVQVINESGNPASGGADNDLAIYKDKVAAKEWIEELKEYDADSKYGTRTVHLVSNQEKKGLDIATNLLKNLIYSQSKDKVEADMAKGFINKTTFGELLTLEDLAGIASKDIFRLLGRLGL